MLNLGIGFGLYNKRGYRWHDYFLFANGENGFLYDFSRADTLFQEATGITPAGVDQNVGLALDISKWGGKTLAQVLAAQAELVVNGGFDNGTTGWSTNDVGATIAVVAGELQLTTDGAAKGVVQQIVLAANTSFRLLVGKARLGTASSGALRIDTIAGGWAIQPSGNPITLSSSDQAIDCICRTGASGITINIYLRAGAAGTLYLDNVSIKEIPGNRASQATSGARPVLKAGGLTRYDGSDDNLLTTFKFDAGGKGSLALKFNKAVGNSSQILMGARNASTDDVILVLAADGRILANVGTGANLTGGSNRAGQTAIAVLTWDGTTVNLYSDEGLLASQSQSGSVTIANAVALAASSVASLFASVDIYQALAINRALTPAEIVKLTNAWSY